MTDARERVLAGLRGEETDRPPVVCPGGMMCFAVNEVMAQTGAWWPNAHRDPEAMARLAAAMQQATGFDSIGVPFCMTVEAEALGAEIDYGTERIQPHIVREPLEQVEDADTLTWDAPPERDRRQVVLDAIRLLRQRAPDVAIVGSVVGPFSLAGQLYEASLLFRAMIRRRDAVHSLLQRATGFIRDFALQQVEAGADVIMIADPNATGEIIGGEGYRQFVAPYLETLIGDIRATGTPVVLHICGNARTILEALAELRVDAISVDETVNLGLARATLNETRLMGNVGADVLEAGPESALVSWAEHALEMGVDVLSPACGVSAATPVEHLRLLAQVARDGG